MFCCFQPLSSSEDLQDISALSGSGGRVTSWYGDGLAHDLEAGLFTGKYMMEKPAAMTSTSERGDSFSSLDTSMSLPVEVSYAPVPMPVPASPQRPPRASIASSVRARLSSCSMDRDTIVSLPRRSRFKSFSSLRGSSLSPGLSDLVQHQKQYTCHDVDPFGGNGPSYYASPSIEKLDCQTSVFLSLDGHGGVLPLITPPPRVFIDPHE